MISIGRQITYEPKGGNNSNFHSTVKETTAKIDIDIETIPEGLFLMTDPVIDLLNIVQCLR